MIDTCHLETPRIVQYAKSFIPLLRQSETPEWRDKVWRVHSGGAYAKTLNCEKLGLPVLIHMQPRWNQKGGDKIEILQAGDKRVSEMTGLVREVFDFDAENAKVMRLDLTADVKGVTVDWFRRNVRIALKQTHRTHLTAALEVSRRQAETIYGGIAPNQYRIYNKTLHRLNVLLPKHNRKRKSEGLSRETFQEVFGYEPNKVITRIERQMGGREPGKVFGIEYFGEINAAANIDPFTRLKFPDVEIGSAFLDGVNLLALETLRSFIDDSNDGIQNARNHMRRAFDNLARTDREREVARRKFYRYWKLFEPHLLSSEGASLVTRAQIVNEYKATTMLQLAA